MRGKNMERIFAAAVAVVFAVTLVVSGAWPFPNSGTTYSDSAEPITIGVTPYEYSALTFIAEDQGYFAGNGLSVTIRNFNTTLAALKGLENDETDISSSSEYTLLPEAFKKENISVIGCIDKYQTIYLISRKDRGIENASDLKGKKIGLTRKGQVEFSLGRFLDLHGMSIHDVTLVDLLPSQYVDALANGSIDSLVAVDSFIDQSKEKLGSNLILWSAQSSQSGYFVIVCRNNWASSHSEQINRFLKSLVQAEEYTINHPAEAKAIVQKRLNYTDASIAAIWPNHRFSLTLDQSLIAAMEDEGRWMIANNLTSEKKIPNFRNYVNTKGLEVVNPEAVNIIG